MGASMNYDEYVKLQTEVHGQLKKPKRYRDGERRAINWFFKYEPADARILDVGCGVGIGMRHLHNIHFDKVVGIELNKKKVEMCLRRGLDVVHGDIAFEHFESYGNLFDIVWSSHSFEHCKPNTTMINLFRLTKLDAKFFFVLPYPDLSPNEAHCGSEEMGLDIDDEGATLVKWFEDRGLELIEKTFDDRREKEIWLKFRRKYAS